MKLPPRRVDRGAEAAGTVADHLTDALTALFASPAPEPGAVRGIVTRVVGGVVR